MTSARRTPVAAGCATASPRGTGEPVATTFPAGAADWRTAGAPAPGEGVVAAGFDGMTDEGGIANPDAGAPDDAGAGACTGAGEPDVDAALRSAPSSIARRSRAVAWARVAASPRASAVMAAR